MSAQLESAEPVANAPLAVRGEELAQSAGATLSAVLVDSAPVAIYHTNAAGEIVYANPAYRRIFGLELRQSLSEWSTAVHPDDRVRMERDWDAFCAHPGPATFEYRTRMPGQGVRFLTEQVVAADGAAGFVGTITDITDLTAARDDLRRMEGLFRDTFEQAPVGVAYADRDGRLFRCNHALAAILESTPSELNATRLAALSVDPDFDEHANDLARLWRREIPSHRFESRWRRKAGKSVWVRVTCSLVRVSDDADDHLVAFIEDIDARKRTELALEESRMLVEVMIAELPVALMACDADGRITHHNRAAQRLFEIETGAVTRTGSGAPLPAAPVYLADGVTELAPDEQPLARALRGEAVSDLELAVTCRDSDGAAAVRTTLASARRLQSADGRLLGAVAVVNDITERRLAELELERIHKQLVIASRQAGMAEVATNVLHNVGNTLNSVNVSASLVTERVKQSKAPSVRKLADLLREHGSALREFLEHDERGKRVPEYLAGLGDQLLAEQRGALVELASLRDNLEHIKDTVSMQQNYAKLCGVTETVRVADLVEDCLRLNAGAFARHGVELRCEFDAVDPITVDKHKVLQILVNLVRNAKYACDESGRSDKLVVIRVEGDAAGVKISVIDNGVGIAPENMSRLFHHGFTTRKSGHGFGLHSGALAAQELGGSLHAHSEGEGRGASFVLRLPYVSRSAAGD
jgi:PAS domain S-box-containing protein